MELETFNNSAIENVSRGIYCVLCNYVYFSGNCTNKWTGAVVRLLCFLCQRSYLQSCDVFITDSAIYTYNKTNFEVNALILNILIRGSDITGVW